MKNIMKKVAVVMVLSICLAAGFPGGAFAEEVASFSESKVLVNGGAVDFEAYLINETTYFKLRDVALVLNGTESNFDVKWDGDLNAINLVSGEEYEPAGGELVLPENKDAGKAVLSDSKIFLNGEEVELEAYTIKQNNYFKLRDLAEALGFEVGWNQEEATITIDTPEVEEAEEAEEAEETEVEEEVEEETEETEDVKEEEVEKEETEESEEETENPEDEKEEVEEEEEK